MCRTVSASKSMGPRRRGQPGINHSFRHSCIQTLGHRVGVGSGAWRKVTDCLGAGRTPRQLGTAHRRAEASGGWSTREWGGSGRGCPHLPAASAPMPTCEARVCPFLAGPSAMRLAASSSWKPPLTSPAPVSWEMGGLLLESGGKDNTVLRQIHFWKGRIYL